MASPVRLRINVFTPLPPVLTDIANHSAGWLPHLAERADVAVWTAQAGWEFPDAPGLNVREFDPASLPARELNAADATFFNFGNNAGFHREIFEAAQLVPGVAVLHDLSLQHFFAALAGSRAGAAVYLDLMRRHHGAEGAADAERFLLGKLPVDALAERYPLTLGATGRAIAIVAHNQAGADALRPRTRLPVFHVPLSLRFSDVPEPRRPRAAPPYLLVVFGFIGANRRLASTLQALAALPERGLFRLDILGHVEDRAGTEALVAQLGLGDEVRLHGYVAPDALNRALADADLAINLRFPTMGEASGSQLRIWAHALPSVVSRVGWYATLPEDAVFHIDPANEIPELVWHLLAFAADRERYLLAGRRGREIVLATHAPERYADALLAIAAQASALHVGRAALDLAHSAAGALLEMVDAPTLRPAAPGVARAVTQLMGLPA